ncbi:hypothetical protein Taro_040526 [Colocasia esculenta]|uniref:Pentatricopeptide repeat-containing protein n=1 Tax=Colocasia esculenta TaxID=4460 RepID=A0A843WDG6_COLES|nr:hypothetical protein [Colocasia esculenta]
MPPEAIAFPRTVPCAPPFSVPVPTAPRGGFRSCAASLPVAAPLGGRDVWRRRRTAIDGPPGPLVGNVGAPREHHRRQSGHRYLDRSVDMGELLASLAETTTADELHAVMSPYLNSSGGSGPGRRLPLSLRFMVGLLSREPDWRRSLALLDWMLDAAGYPPSIFAYNVVLRNALRAGQWALAGGLAREMHDRHSLAPDRCTYATLISSLGKAGRLDDALSWLHRMERDGVRGDLVLYSTLIELARKLGDHSKAISVFSRLRSYGIAPDLVAYNSMINVFGKAGLLREAHQLLREMEESDPASAVRPDIVSYSTLLTAYVENRRYVEALSLFSEMRERRIPLDLTTFNIMIDVYGQLGMPREADRSFWSMRKLGVDPNVVSYNTLLRVYGEAELFGEAIHLFRLMQRKGAEQNVVTYNTMIGVYGKSLEHEKAGNLVQEMQKKGIHPNAVTYSIIISIWGKAGKLERAVQLFQKLRTSGAKIDHVLYQTMIAVYERAGLVAHAKRLLSDLKESDDNSVPKETVITILANAGRVEEAAQLFRRAFEVGEVKDIAVFQCMMDLFARNKKHRNVIEVFEKMRGAGYFPDSDMIGVALNAYGKLQEFRKAESLYREMQEEGCVFSDQVHFQMLSLLGARRDFNRVESFLKELGSNPNINKQELRIVAAGVYERANRLDDASRIIWNQAPVDFNETLSEGYAL